jgi:hypothetical protein
MPRFDMRDKDGIIFDPIAPRAGERLTAKCTLVGLTPNDKRHVCLNLLFGLRYPNESSSRFKDLNRCQVLRGSENVTSILSASIKLTRKSI